MANTIKVKRSETASAVPTGLSYGELSCNVLDKKLWIGSSTGSSVLIVDYNAASGIKLTDLSSTATGLTYTNTTGVFSLTSGYSIPTTSLQTDWTTAYNNRITSLTTTGSSGSATLSNNTLNIPAYTLAGLGGAKLSDISSTATGLTYTSATGVFSFTSGYSIPTTTKQGQWDTAYSSYLQWDGGSTSLVAATGRTSLGATTVGANFFTLTNPTAITFPRINADNTVSTLDAATFRTAIGAGTSSTSGTVTSVGLSLPTGLAISGSPITSTGTLTVTFSAGYSIPTTASQTQWDTAYSNRITSLTTTGSSGAATLSSNILNVPNYTANGLLPSQTGNSGKYLKTDGTNTSWGTVTAGAVFTVSATAPSSPANGDSWFDTTNGIYFIYVNDGNSSQWIESSNTTNSVIPTGSIVPFAGATAPNGYLLCDGSSVSSTSYLALHAVISNLYGGSAYTGATGLNFNLPDYRGRVLIGSGTGTGLTARVNGTTYGAESHTLASGNIPQMTTGYMSANASHNHGSGATGFWVYNSAGAGTIAGGSTYNASAGGSSVTASTNTDHTHTVGTASPTAISNLQPSIGVNYLIKT